MHSGVLYAAAVLMTSAANLLLQEADKICFVAWSVRVFLAHRLETVLYEFRALYIQALSWLVYSLRSAEMICESCKQHQALGHNLY